MLADPAKLRAAKALVARPNGWTQCTFDGKSTIFTDLVRRDASCYCMLGALAVAYDCTTYEEAKVAHTMMRDVIGDGSIPVWNDAPGRTQAEVVAAFEAAAARAEELQREAAR